jgi:hypothetical protein
MKVAPATSSLIRPVTKRGNLTLKQKNTPAAMKVAPATSSLIPPVTKEVILLRSKKIKITGSHEGCAGNVLANSNCKKEVIVDYAGEKKLLAAMPVTSATS